MRPQPKPKTCSRTGKKRWPDHKSAVLVLHHASISRTRAAEFGSESHRGEVRTNQCDACGGWHTTSRESMALPA